MTRARARIAVEPLVLRLSERPRTVVDVEQDHVERGRRSLDGVEHVANHDPATWVGERMLIQHPEVLAVPLDELGHELHDCNFGLRGHALERGPQRVAEAEPTD